MIFTISDKPFFKDNPEALAVPIFKKVGDHAMKFIALVYGYNTPYRQLRTGDRKKKALDICGIPRTKTGRPSKLEKDLMENRGMIPAAIAEYQDIQFDADRDALEAREAYIDQCKTLLRKPDKTPKEIDQSLKIMKEYNTMVEDTKALREILELRNQEEFKLQLDDEEEIIEDDNLLEKYLATKESK